MFDSMLKELEAFACSLTKIDYSFSAVRVRFGSHVAIRRQALMPVDLMEEMHLFLPVIQVSCDAVEAALTSDLIRTTVLTAEGYVLLGWSVQTKTVSGFVLLEKSHVHLDVDLFALTTRIAEFADTCVHWVRHVKMETA